MDRDAYEALYTVVGVSSDGAVGSVAAVGLELDMFGNW